MDLLCTVGLVTVVTGGGGFETIGGFLKRAYGFVSLLLTL